MSYPLTKEDYPKTIKLLESIGMDPNCEPFLTPVAWEGKFNPLNRILTIFEI
jgi:hypothetical protein